MLPPPRPPRSSLLAPLRPTQPPLPVAPQGAAAQAADRKGSRPVTGDHPVFRFCTGDAFADIAVSHGMREGAQGLVPGLSVLAIGLACFL